MPSRRFAALHGTMCAALVLVALACSGGRGPQIVALSPLPGPCGAWTAAVEVADLRGQAVALWVDGAVVKRWRDVWGDHRWTVEGTGQPFASATFELLIEDTPSGRSAQVALAGGGIALRVHPERLVVPVGVAPALELTLAADCPIEGLRWRASTGTWSEQGAMEGELTRLLLPVHPPGLHTVEVEVWNPHLRQTARASLVVGDALNVDRDGDGYPASIDCDDDDPTVNPGAAERPEPNGRDDNCDGRIDEGTVAYDDDGDGWTELDGDCNDFDAKVFPGAPEIPNCRDDDCDGEIDEDVPFVPWPDDGFEQPGGAPYRVPGQARRLELPLPLVSRDLRDEERIEFWSHDGDWDNWGIDVVARRLPANSAFGVQIRRFDGAVVAAGTLARDGDMVRAVGRPFKDDSGVYEVVIRPNRLHADGCPVELYLESR